MKWLLAALLSGLLATAATCQELSPQAFQSRTEGHAFGTYFSNGELQGIEIFQSGRKVIWQAANGTCQNGIWQVQNGHICYLYEGFNPGHCMIYRATGDTLVGTTDGGERFILRQTSPEEVTCSTDEPLLSRSMHAHRHHLVLARQVEGQLAVGDQRQFAAIGAVD